MAALQGRNLRQPEVLELAGFGGNSSLYYAIKHYGFPRPLKLGARSVAWREVEVRAWIDARAANRVAA